MDLPKFHFSICCSSKKDLKNPMLIDNACQKGSCRRLNSNFTWRLNLTRIVAPIRV